MKEKMTIVTLRNLAKKGKWDKVDETLPDVCNDPKYIHWAVQEGLESRNSKEVDLAASILEKAKLRKNQFGEIAPLLSGALHRNIDNYGGFRAACALAAHGLPDKYRGEVLAVLDKKLSDRDVQDIAREYLSKIKKRQ